MSIASHLIRVNLRAFWSKLLEPRRGRALQLSSYLVVVSLFLGGGYSLFLRIFTYLQSLESA